MMIRKSRVVCPREIRRNGPKTQVPILLHTDAAQAIGKLKVDVAELQASMTVPFVI
jgi:cysteine sulfinate desulfinase/cysteine desulfurase-like protein